MSATLINLIIQLIAGAIGGNAVGAASKDVDLGTPGNTIAGAVGGVAGGQILTALIPVLAGVGNNVDIAALAGQAVGGGIAGAIVRGYRWRYQEQDDGLTIGPFVIRGVQVWAGGQSKPPTVWAVPSRP